MKIDITKVNGYSNWITNCVVYVSINILISKRVNSLHFDTYLMSNLKINDIFERKIVKKNLNDQNYGNLLFIHKQV